MMNTHLSSIQFLKSKNQKNDNNFSNNVYINIDQAELRLPKSEQIFSERYRRGETIRAIIKSVEVTSKGPDIIVSKGLSLASSNVIDPLPERVKRKEPLKPISFKLFFRVSK